MTTSPRTILRINFQTITPDNTLYEQLLTVLEGVTPRVQANPADFSATVDLTGALRYWKCEAEGVAAVIRLRILALYGVQSSAGAGPNVGIATTAAASTPPGAVTVVGHDPYEIAAFLRPVRGGASRHRPRHGRHPEVGVPRGVRRPRRGRQGSDRALPPSTRGFASACAGRDDA